MMIIARKIMGLLKWLQFALASPAIFAEFLLNNRKKERLLEQYQSCGQTVDGIVLKVCIFGNPRRPDYTEISYAYVAPGTDYLSVRPPVKFRGEVVLSRRISILVLPDHPNSGYPNHLITEPKDDGSYRSCWDFFWSCCCLWFISDVCGLQMVHDRHDLYYWIGFSICLTMLFLIGYCISLEWYRQWQHKMLHCRLQTIRPSQRTATGGIPYASVPTTPVEAEVLSILEDRNSIDAIDAASEDIELAQGFEEGSTARSSTVTSEVPVAEAVHSTMPISSAANNKPAVATVESVVQQDSNDESAIFSIFDATENDDKSQQLRKAIKDDDWEFLRDFFAKTRGQMNERGFYIELVSKEVIEKYKQLSTNSNDSASDSRNAEQLSIILDAWVSAEPSNVDCRLIRGAVFIAWAWDARTARLARDVPKEELATFDRRIKLAFDHRIKLASNELKRAEIADPSDALIYAYQSTVLRATGGSSQKNDMIAIRRKLAASNDPNNLFAHKCIMQYYCKEWHGSHDEMFNYARSCCNGLPEGHPLWIMILLAHREMHLFLAMQIFQGFDLQTMMAVSNYYKQPNVRQEILQSYHQYIGSHKLEVPTTAAEDKIRMVARNYYTQILLEIGVDHTLVRREILTIGTNPTQKPWSPESKEKAIEEYKKACCKVGISFEK